MFPYLRQKAIPLGAVRIYPFGLLVLTGILVGSAVLLHRARRQGLEPATARNFCATVVVCGLLGAHLVRLLFFAPQLLREGLPVLLDLGRGGIYSFGGLLGGLAGGFCFLRWAKLGRAARWQYVDLLAFAFPFGWLFGRAGCAIAHDHPGIAASNWLAVAFPEGPRYDLGLIEFLFTLPVIALFLWLDRRPRPAGFYCGLFLILYGPFRFWLDGLHSPGTPSFLLTPDQFFGLLATLAGGWLLCRLAATAA